MKRKREGEKEERTDRVEEKQKQRNKAETKNNDWKKSGRPLYLIKEQKRIVGDRKEGKIKKEGSRR